MTFRPLCPLLLATLMLTSCRTKDREILAPTPTPTPTPAVVQPAPTPPPTRQPANMQWPGLYLNKNQVPNAETALEVGGLVVTPREYNDGLQAYRRANPDSGTETGYLRELREDLLLLGYLRDSGLMIDQAFQTRARRVLRGVLADMVLDEANKQSLFVTDEEIRARYDANFEQYRQPRRVKIRLILVSTAGESQRVLDRLEAGESFAALAAEVSQHPSRDEGGDIAPFPEGTYNAALEDLAFSLGVGDTGTVATNRGVFIVQKLSDISATATPLEDVREEIASTLRAEKWEQGRRELLERLEREQAVP